MTPMSPMSVIEPPIRTETPLSEAGESSSESGQPMTQLHHQLLLQQQQQAMAAATAATCSPPNQNGMSKASYDAIFGRAASASSAGCGRSPVVAPIVAHEDDSFRYFEQQQQQQRLFQQQQSVAADYQGAVANYANVTTTLATATSTGRSPRMTPVQVPSSMPPSIPAPAAANTSSRTQSHNSSSTASAPTALMIMRRRRSNSDANGSGSNSSGGRGNKGKDELGMSNSGRSAESSQEKSSEESSSSSGGKASKGSNGSSSSSKGRKSSKSKSPKSSPSLKPKNAPIDPNDPLNYNATMQQHQPPQQAYGNNGTIPGMHPHHPHNLLTAQRYNSSLHSTLGGYPMGTPTQLTHPSVTLELIARDRARWEADYYGGHGMDYGMDYGYEGSYYGATPSFRGMANGIQGMQQMQQQGAMMQQQGMEMHKLHQQQQQQQQGGMVQQQQGMQGNPNVDMQQQLQQRQQLEQIHELHQRMVQRPAMPPQVPPQQQVHHQGQHVQQQHLLQPQLPGATMKDISQGVPSSASPPVPSSEQMPAEINMTPTTKNRVFLERDYKKDRVWQEDDHSSRPERRHTDLTSNKESDKLVDESKDLPPVPQLRTGENDRFIQQQVPPGAQQQRPQVPHGTIPVRAHRMSIDDYDVVSYHSGSAMAAPYYPVPPPPTPVHGMDGRDPRIRQISDMSTISGPHVPFYPPHHPYHGLMYPPTPTSLGSMVPPHHPQLAGVYQHQDPHQGWVNDPHQQVQASVNVPQPSAQVKTATEDSKSCGEKASTVKTSTLSTNAADPAPSSKSNKKKSVSFATLQIRTYETILGDNPSCSGGPSLGLGWRYDPSHATATVDEYEAHQAQLNGTLPNGQPYTMPPEDLVLHRFEREAILLNTGYTRQDLADSVRSLNKVKNKRRQTVHNLPVAFMEERVEVVRRTLRRWMWKKERTRYMYEDWKKKNVGEVRTTQDSKE